MVMSKYTFTPRKIENTPIVHLTASYQPDKNRSGFVYSFSYNRETNVVTSNIGNGDVSEEIADRIREIVKFRTLKN